VVNMLDRVVRLGCCLVGADLRLQLKVSYDSVEHGLRHQPCTRIVEVKYVHATRRLPSGACQIETHRWSRTILRGSIPCEFERLTVNVFHLRQHRSLQNLCERHRTVFRSHSHDWPVETVETLLGNLR